MDRKWIKIKDRITEIEAWYRDGATDEIVAAKLEISRPTLYKYRKLHKELDKAMKRGKDATDITVENALYKRAIGYRYKETTKELCKDPETGKMKLVVTKEVVKEIPPEVQAQTFWLKNRKKETWKDKWDLNVGGQGDNPVLLHEGIDLSKLSVEELREMIINEET